MLPTLTSSNYVPTNNSVTLSSNIKKLPNKTNTTSISPPKKTIYHLTRNQMQEQRKKGLCYYCDEPYRFGHNCRWTVHILITLDNMKDVASENDESDLVTMTLLNMTVTRVINFILVYMLCQVL